MSQIREGHFFKHGGSAAPVHPRGRIMKMAKRNRLNLNFQLESAAERAEFVRTYLEEIDFTPNADELETIGNYILWGKNEKGVNAQQEGDVEIKKWATQPVESLEALMEIPGFQETQLKTLNAPQVKVRRVVFNREEALATAPEYLRPYYEDLFRQIDTVELMLNYYELWSGRRKLPPRESLIGKFSEEEQKELNERAMRLTQFKYLKLKRLLVDLRQEQYTWKDTYSAHVQTHLAAVPSVVQEESVWIGEDVTVLPLGLCNNTPLARKLFGGAEPSQYTGVELWELTDLLWRPPRTAHVLDFSNEAHLLALFTSRADLRDARMEDPSQIYGAAASIVATLTYYEDQAELTPLQKDLLEMKLAHKQNYEIAQALNKKYGKTYNENYISTIFHKKIITSIAEAARQHRLFAENIFFPENFKRCKDCGRLLLMTSDNFVRQKKSSDGFSPRCKACEKEKRKRRSV